MTKLLAIAAFSFLACAAALAGPGEVSVSVSPQPVVAGEAAELRLSWEGDSFPEIERLPEVKGLSWGQGASHMANTQIVNFKRSVVSESVYTFVAEKPGPFSIPPLHVKAGKMKLITNALNLEAVPSRFGQESGLLFMKFELLTGKDKIYVGEEIPAEVRVYQQEGVKTQLSWPELDFGNAATILFKDYRSVNPENEKFDRFRQLQETIKGRRYNIYSFRTAFRAMSPGLLKPSASVKASVVVPGSGRRGSSPFDDDFFFGDVFARNSVEKLLSAEASPVEVHQLPPAPGDSIFLGLVGEWNVSISVSEGPCRVGEPVTLRVKVSGSGSLDSLKPPQLELPGFRVYPPELDKSSAFAEIRYVLIPSEEGESEVSLSVSSFDCATGSYKPVPFTKRLKVGKANGLAGASASQGQVVMSGRGEPAKAQEEPAAEGRKAPSGVLYLKRDLGRGVELPLWRNAAIPCVSLLALGLLAFGSLWVWQSRRAALLGDPRLLRRSAARARRGKVLKAVEAAKPEALSDLAAMDVVPYLSELLDAPPGSGAGELADKLSASDPELAACLRRIADAAWSPALKSSFNDDFKARLLKSLSKLSLLLAALLLPGLLFAASPEPKASVAAVKSAPASLDAALTAYDAGDFQAAAAFFKSKIDPARPSPAALYDLGNCLYQMGELPKALVCYERAMRLSPRDSDILENLNLVRRKLALPQLYKIESPSSALPCLRDFLRPDEWAVALFLGVALALASLGLRRLSLPGSLWVSVFSAGLALALAASASYVSQSMGTYSQSDAVVTVRNASVRTLPSDSAPLSDLKLRPGETVKVEERRMDWARVRAGEAEGWLRTSDIASLWLQSPSGD